MIKTTKLTANTEQRAADLGGAHCRVNNNTAGMLYASAKSGIQPGGDDVTAIPSGRGDYVVGAQGTVYLLSDVGGSVQLEGTDILTRPFDSAAVTGGKAAGNPLVMDGLQGGVPFPKITVTGDIAGKELTLIVCGKNLIPFPYSRKSGTYNGLTVDIADDGKFSVNGTASANTTVIEFATESKPIKLVGGAEYTLSCSQPYNVDTFNIFFRVCHADGTKTGITSYPKTFTAMEGDYLTGSLWIGSGKTMEVDNVAVQLEVSGIATDYEPYGGAEYKITPDSSPYTVTDDIRQQQGRNTLCVFGEGNPEISAEYSGHNSALKRIYTVGVPANGGSADKVGEYGVDLLYRHNGAKASADDCNAAVEPGSYLFNGCGANSPTGAPVSAGTYFLLFNVRHDEEDLIFQTAVFIHGSSTYIGKRYARYCDRGAWSEWKELG